MAFCKKCQSKVKTILSKIDDRIINIVGVSLEFTNKIKELLNSPAAITVVSLTPTKIDDVLRMAAINALDIALKYLGWGQTKPSLTDATINDFMKWLNEMPPATKDAYLLKIASIMSAEMDERRYKQNTYDTAVQVNYSLSK